MDIRVELDRLIRVQGGELIQFAYQLTRSVPAAQDLVQDALVSVLHAGRSGQLELLNSKAYLIRTISNRFLRLHRSKGPHEDALTDVEQDSTGVDPFEVALDREALWQLLGSLPERMRLVLVLRYFLDESDPDIAQTLGVTQATVRSIASRSLARLRSQMSSTAADETRQIP